MENKDNEKEDDIINKEKKIDEKKIYEDNGKKKKKKKFVKIKLQIKNRYYRINKKKYFQKESKININIIK